MLSIGRSVSHELGVRSAIGRFDSPAWSLWWRSLILKQASRGGWNKTFPSWFICLDSWERGKVAEMETWPRTCSPAKVNTDDLGRAVGCYRCQLGPDILNRRTDMHSDVSEWTRHPDCPKLGNVKRPYGTRQWTISLTIFHPKYKFDRNLDLPDIPFQAIISLQDFSHGTTAQPSCHVENFVAISPLSR